MQNDEINLEEMEKRALEIMAFQRISMIFILLSIIIISIHAVIDFILYY